MENKVDDFVLLGDFCIGLAYPNEVIDCIRSTGSGYVVTGNEDEALIQFAAKASDQWEKGQFEAVPWFYNNLTNRNRNYLCDLPREIIIKNDQNPPVFAFHKPQRYFTGTTPCSLGPHYFASGMDNKEFNQESFDMHSHSLLNSDTELQLILSNLENGIYIFGHTHIPLCWEWEGKLLINPGSCGLPLDFNRNASYGILECTGNSYHVTLRRVAYDVNAAIDYTRKSVYAEEVRVWSGIITKELESAREQAVPFIRFTEKYAADIQDEVRPFCAETWNTAYEAWCSN